MFGVSQGIETAHATNVTNAGTIRGQVDGLFEGGSGNYKISNSATGVIEGGDRGIFITSFGTHTINNAGRIEGSIAAITASFGVEKVTNWGVLAGDVSLGGGDDVFTNFEKVGTVIKNGSIDSTLTIDLADGNDKFFEGNHAEQVKDGNGSDTVKFGGGSDFYDATGDHWY